ncbi:TonB-dependent receptor [Altericroceibacterium endophyticum]|uniref:TonB-dependent receptor n=1 Tax=Altericroceibacterium endophyticum TaxID=1808508 RepID=A0A6I4TAH4_9SPHN|nr:TonB-dependent receptor [Altericroceibacterium endophyticum]MXO66765.1 TonB-dependent receptor [Altericroceibacterium endophyticum]
MIKHITGASIGALAVAIATPAAAQTQESAPAVARTGIQPIIVTATKRSEDLQDVPLSVQAIGEEGLNQLGVETFDDYLDQLPNVTAGGSGPGQSTIYIRGLASTTPNLTTAGVAGLAPNVAFYLDEQPLAQPGRNLDVYAADMERIEVLAGPQGTLFGASSQAGVVRLITNKPSLAGFDAKAKAGVSFTKGGETSYKTEVMLNVPVTNNFALRGVAFLDDQGGYIDNVHGQRTMRGSARFRPEGTERYNGVPVNSDRAGFQSDPESLAYIDNDVTFQAADNARLVEDNFNDTQYSGFRASALWEMGPDWRLTVAHARQSVESDGVFFADPELDLDNLEIQRYSDDRLEDDFSNTSWTLEGRLAMLDIVYTGAYTDRETHQNVGYSDYLFVGQYIPYYMCDTAVVYPGDVANAPADPTCYAPNLAVTSDTDTTVFTQELRVNTPQEERIRATVGGFYSSLVLKERNDYYYASEQVRGYDGVTRGFSDIYPFTNTEVTGTVGNAAPGYFSDAGPLPDNVGFRNDVKRTDKQFGIFGEVAFDIVPDMLTITGGARYYDVEVDLEGAATSAFCKLNSPIFGANKGVPVEDQVNIPGCGGTNLSDKYGADNPYGNPDKATTDGVIFKGTLTFTPTEDLLFYGTYSEGFRPGLLNRPGGADGPGDYKVPFALDTDEVKNYEFGWKTSLFDRQLRFNGSAFYVDVSRLQTTIFDPSITNLFFSDNAANAEIKGVEGDLTFQPYAVPGLTVAGAFSFLDTEITEVLTPTDDVVKGSPLAYAPEFQGNLRVRYEWDLSNDLRAHIMPQVVHSGSKYTDIIEINKLKLDSYTTFSLTAGVEKDQWSFEVYGENLTDKRAQVAGSFNFDVPRITVNRPLTVGMRVSFDY